MARHRVQTRLDALPHSHATPLAELNRNPTFDGDCLRCFEWLGAVSGGPLSRELGKSATHRRGIHNRDIFEGFDHDVELDILAVHQSPYAVHTRYAVRH